MFEDIIGDVKRDIRYIEIRYADGVWRRATIKKLFPGFTFRYVDRREVHYRAATHGFQHDSGKWGVVADLVED